MNSYICVGTEIRDRAGRKGVVFAYDKDSKLAVIRVRDKYFVEDVRNLTVVSYKEVE